MVNDWNLDIFKKQAREYYSSGKYYLDIVAEIDKATAIVNSTTLKNPSVVIDIDETMVSLWSIMSFYDFGWPDQALEEIMIRTDFPCFDCVKNFVELCLIKGVKVFVLSSRRKKYTAFTKELLVNAGYPDYDGLILRDDNDHGTIQNYKIAQRKALIDQKEHILINIGDQDSDLAGGYADNEIKIPNRFYLIDATMIHWNKK